MTSIPVDLRDDGLLWLINATCFHPRGFALGVDLDDDGNTTGLVLLGDGLEPWRYASEADVIASGGDPACAADLDNLFTLAEACFARARQHVAEQSTLDLEGGN